MLDGLYLNPGALVVCLGDFAADSNAVYASLLKTTRALKLTNLRVTVNTTVTKQNTDFNTVALYNGSTKIMDLFSTGPDSSAGTTITAGAWTDIDVAAANEEIAAASDLNIRFVKTGNGLAMKGLTFQLEGYLLPQ